jgi:Protein  of unknown function (DUF3018)
MPEMLCRCSWSVLADDLELFGNRAPGLAGQPRFRRLGSRTRAELSDHVERHDRRGLQGGWMLLGSCDRLHVTSREVEVGGRTRSKSSRDKVRAHRKRLRKQGLRPIQIWVPDMRSPAFAAEAHRQSLAVARSPHANEDQDFINAVSDWGTR